MEFTTLHNGVKMPQIALGVFMIPEDEDAKKACLSAFELGYRHIDSAHHYYNEAGVGAAVRECGIPREELWITSKIWPDEYADETAIDKMLARFGLDYLDLVILHQQVGNYMAGHRSLEKAYKAGKVRGPSGSPILSRSGWRKCWRPRKSSPKSSRWRATPTSSRRRSRSG